MSGMERFENRPSVDKGSIGPGDLKIVPPQSDEIESKCRGKARVRVRSGLVELG